MIHIAQNCIVTTPTDITEEHDTNDQALDNCRTLTKDSRVKLPK